MDQRTRERLPGARPGGPGRRGAQGGCGAAASRRDTRRGHAVHRRRPDAAPAGHKPGHGRIWADDPATGKRRDLTVEEDRAFWGWATVEVLRHHRHPDRGTHRAVPPQPDPVPAARHRRADPAAADRPVQDRPRTAAGHQARTRRRPVGDHHPDPRRRRRRPARGVLRRQRKLWNPPMPLLFQRPAAVEDRPRRREVHPGTPERRPGRVRPHRRHRAPLRFTPPRLSQDLHHRRDHARDAAAHRPARRRAPRHQHHHGIQGGLPRGVINGHRAFIARRRALRPSAEYRIPTDGEWEEFLGHFERRKLALGDCGRASAPPASTSTAA